MTAERFDIRARAIILHEGKLLIVKHTPKVDFYVLPGGHVEAGESIPECVRREIIEELGVEPVVGRLLYVNQFTNAAGLPTIDLFFEVTNGADFLDLTKHDRTHAFELSEIRWISPEDDARLLPGRLAEDFKKGKVMHEGVIFIH